MATITTGGTAQDALAADNMRRGFAFQNQSAGDLYVRWDGSAATADGDSLKVPPGAYYETPPGIDAGNRISVRGATTGQEYWIARRGA